MMLEDLWERDGEILFDEELSDYEDLQAVEDYEEDPG